MLLRIKITKNLSELPVDTETKGLHFVTYDQKPQGRWRYIHCIQYVHLGILHWFILNLHWLSFSEAKSSLVVYVYLQRGHTPSHVSFCLKFQWMIGNYKPPLDKSRVTNTQTFIVTGNLLMFYFLTSEWKGFLESEGSLSFRSTLIYGASSKHTWAILSHSYKLANSSV